jgi:hypothetical protein
MDNKYKFLEEFLLMATSGFKFSWDINPDAVEFTNRANGTQEYAALHFYYLSLNELKGKNNQKCSITVNVNKVPKLMSYLSVAEYSYQISARLELSEYQFSKLSKSIDEILTDGKYKSKPVEFISDDSKSFAVDLTNDRRLELTVRDIDRTHLGFQVLMAKLKFKESNTTTSFKRLIPLHQIKNLPFLSSIAQMPEFKNVVLNPDIDSFITTIANMDCNHLSPIAQTIELNMQLKNELNPHNDGKKKRVKI